MRMKNALEEEIAEVSVKMFKRAIQ